MSPELLLVTTSTDFNSVDAAGRVASLLEFVPVLWYPLEPGRLVKLQDLEGNSCLGIIDEVNDDLLYIRPAWSTWEASSHTDLSVPSLTTGSVVGGPETTAASAPPTPVPNPPAPVVFV